MLVSMERVLNRAAAEGYGVVAPNVYNAATVEAAFQAADEFHSPLIMDVYDELDIEKIADAVRFFAKRYDHIATVLNLDHSKTYEVAVRAIRCGFTSIMADRSNLEFEENVRQVSEIVKMAHAVGVSVEAELGHVGQGAQYAKDRDAGLTRVEEAETYIERTQVDALAVAVGTAHGRYVGTPSLDFERLADLKARCSVPLVLHGGSSSGDANLRKAVETGISKVNIGTDLRTAGAAAVTAYLDGCEYPDYVKMIDTGQVGYKEMIQHYMTLFGSRGKNE